MNSRRPLLILAKLLSLNGALHGVSAILGTCVTIFVAADGLTWVEHSIGGTSDGAVICHAIVAALSAHRWNVATAAALTTGCSLLLAGVWEKLAQLVRRIAEGRFLDTTTSFILNRLALYLVVSFALDLLTFAAFQPVRHLLTGAFLQLQSRSPELVRGLSEATASVILSGSWSELLLPGLDGSVKLLIAFLSFFSWRVVRRVESVEGELDALKTEQALIV